MGEMERMNLIVDWTSSIGQGNKNRVLKGTFNGKNVAVKISIRPAKKFEIPPAIVSSSVSNDSQLVPVTWSGKIRDPRSKQEHFAIIEPLAKTNLLKHVTGLRERKQFGEFSALKLALNLASIVAALHAHNIIHRNIRPEKILVFNDDEMRLSDSGSAKASITTTVTNTAVHVGAENYMAPEMLRGLPFCSPKSDVYSLGGCLYWIFTGEAPYQGTLLARRCVVEGAPLDMKAVPPGIAQIIQATRNLNHSRRPTADDVANAIYEIYQGRLAEIDPIVLPEVSFIAQFGQQHTEIYPKVLAREETCALVRGDHVFRGEDGRDGPPGGPGEPGSSPESMNCMIGRSGLGLYIEMDSNMRVISSFLMKNAQYELGLIGGNGGDGGAGSADYLGGPGGAGGAGGDLTITTKNPEVIPFVYANVSGGLGGVSADTGRRAPSGAPGSIRFFIVNPDGTTFSPASAFAPRIMKASVTAEGHTDMCVPGERIFISQIEVKNFGDLASPPELRIVPIEYDEGVIELITQTPAPLEPIGPKQTAHSASFLTFRAARPKFDPFPPPPESQRTTGTAVATVQLAPALAQTVLLLSLKLFSRIFKESILSMRVACCFPLQVSSVSLAPRAAAGDTVAVGVAYRNISKRRPVRTDGQSYLCVAVKPLDTPTELTPLRLYGGFLGPAESAPAATHFGRIIPLPPSVEPEFQAVEERALEFTLSSHPLLAPIEVYVHLVVDGHLVHSVSSQAFGTVRYFPPPAPTPLVVLHRGSARADFFALEHWARVWGSLDEIRVFDAGVYGGLLDAAERPIQAWAENHRGMPIFLHSSEADSALVSSLFAHFTAADGALAPDSSASLVMPKAHARGVNFIAGLAAFFEPVALVGSPGERETARQRLMGFPPSFLADDLPIEPLGKVSCLCGASPFHKAKTRLKKLLARRNKEASGKPFVAIIFKRNEGARVGALSAVICRSRLARSLNLSVVSPRAMECEELVRFCVTLRAVGVAHLLRLFLRCAQAELAMPLGEQRLDALDLLSLALQERVENEVRHDEALAASASGTANRIVEFWRHNKDALDRSSIAPLALLAPFVVKKGVRDLLEGRTDDIAAFLPDALEVHIKERIPSRADETGLLGGEAQRVRFAKALTEARHRYSWGNIVVSLTADLFHRPLVSLPSKKSGIIDITG
eukprot:gnl/Chilomastix_cuspidata/796.p1 GENE.gnl/Chilomastix_cuspidata/796~~gnl/Chilomastix_cuspidata/796.p1  ORF type:complete len:1172 (+),score=470.85 gnl/Chilomastix_cuspidata/796:232-3747(+)